jgi:HPr kinase/phosphorylase
LVDVYGVGVLIQGESGVGKSECALELIRAGHRLVADDVVHVRKLTDKIIMGSSDPMIQYHMEIRGLGIINVEMIFGVRAVRRRKHIELLAELRPWEAGKEYDRTGLQAQSKDILGVSIPHLVLPVRPGRNLSVILEVAAINYRMSLMGINPAQNFNQRALEQLSRPRSRP